MDEATADRLVSEARARVQPLERGHRFFLAKRRALSLFKRGSRRLRRRLLGLAGHAVLFSGDDADYVHAEGALFPTAGARLVLGMESDCHENVRSLFWSAPERFAVGYGYALSEDGLWRNHSWVMEGDTVLETTEERLLYFGVRDREDLEDIELYPIRIRIKLPPSKDDPPMERPWVEVLGDGRFRLLNVPYFAQGIAYHDIIELDRDDDSALPHFARVIEPSGYRTIHIDTTAETDRGMDDPLLDQLEDDGCQIELSFSESTTRVRVAVSVPPNMDAEQIERDLAATFAV